MKKKVGSKLITQILEVVSVDLPEDKFRVVGMIDEHDRTFFAESQQLVGGEWVADDAMPQYQRDSVVVPNLEFDPDVLVYLANHGLTKPNDTTDWDSELSFVIGNYPELTK